MKQVETVLVRKVGTNKWIECVLDLKSGNGLSLAVSAEEGLFSSGDGLAINIDTGRQQLLLGKTDPLEKYYIEVYSNTLWDVKGIERPAV